MKHRTEAERRVNNALKNATRHSDIVAMVALAAAVLVGFLSQKPERPHAAPPIQSQQIQKLEK